MSAKEQVTATEYQQNVGLYFDRATARPLKITKHGRASHVLLSADEYERLKSYDTREHIHSRDLDDGFIEELKAAKMDSKHNDLNAELK